MREYKEIYKYEQYKVCSRVTKEKLESRIRGLEEKNPGRATADPLRYRCAILINMESTMIQAPGSGHAGPGESDYPMSGKMSAKWRA